MKKFVAEFGKDEAGTELVCEPCEKASHVVCNAVPWYMCDGSNMWLLIFSAGVWYEY